MEPKATVIADSISPGGFRLTTLEVVMHRFVLAEFNTHRVFSRNSASSRAIPVEKQLARVQDEPAWPVVWAAEQPGMQGGSELEGYDLRDAIDLFERIHDFTANQIELYLGDHPEKSTRLHKSLINRLLEPFMWHTVIVSSTEWDGFWHQRCSELAQPEIHVAADLMLAAYRESEPVDVPYGEWHMPYVTAEEALELSNPREVSVARCTRVSRENHGDLGKTPEEDVQLYGKLTAADPAHASPLEHVATPCTHPDGKHHQGNFTGWDQMRHDILGF